MAGGSIVLYETELLREFMARNSDESAAFLVGVFMVWKYLIPKSMANG